MALPSQKNVDLRKLAEAAGLTVERDEEGVTTAVDPITGRRVHALEPIDIEGEGAQISEWHRRSLEQDEVARRSWESGRTQRSLRSMTANALDTASLGLGDEISGLAAGAASIPAALTGSGFGYGGEVPTEAYTRVRDQIRTGVEDLTQDEPGSANLGRAVGIAATLPLLPAAGVGQASSVAGRIGQAGLAGLKTGSAYGAIGGFGHGEGAVESAVGAVGGGLVGGGLGGGLGVAGGTVGEVARALGTRGGPGAAEAMQEVAAGQRIRGMGGRMPQAREVRNTFPGGIQGFNEQLERGGFGWRGPYTQGGARQVIERIGASGIDDAQRVVQQARQATGDPRAGAVRAGDLSQHIDDLYTRFSPDELASMERLAGISPRQRAVMQGTMDVRLRPGAMPMPADGLATAATPARRAAAQGAPASAPRSAPGLSDIQYVPTGQRPPPLRDPTAGTPRDERVARHVMRTLDRYQRTAAEGISPQGFGDYRMRLRRMANFPKGGTPTPENEAAANVYRAFNAAGDARLAELEPSLGAAARDARLRIGTARHAEGMLARGQEAETNRFLSATDNLQGGAALIASGGNPLVATAAALGNKLWRGSGPFLLGNAAASAGRALGGAPVMPSLAGVRAPDAGRTALGTTQGLLETYRRLTRPGGVPAVAAQPPPEDEVPILTEDDLLPVLTEDDLEN